MYIKRVCLKNIRCFADIDIEFSQANGDCPWTVIVGDNSTGKTTLLRAIAAGLCNESSAAGLMQEAEEGYIRREEKEGEIRIELEDPSDPSRSYRIETTITKVSAGKMTFENVRQETYPKEEFPWDQIFICAYGASRGTSGTGDIGGWSAIDAVYNLFNPREDLQNPELIIRRIKTDGYEDTVLRKLGDILLGDPDAVRPQRSGIKIDGPWGPGMPLRDLSDGYRSCFLWVTDFLGWALLFDSSTSDPSQMSGIVIIDELEQHLHAVWQRTIVHKLRKHFPRMQFIAATHSPLIASSVGGLPVLDQEKNSHDGANDKIVCLELGKDNKVCREYLPSMRHLHVDQVLASRAFKYLIDADPDWECLLKRLSKMKEREEDMTPSEKESYIGWRDRLEPLLYPGLTAVERDIQEKRLKEMRALLKEIPKSP